jgi:hypothetical protein
MQAAETVSKRWDGLPGSRSKRSWASHAMGSRYGEFLYRIAEGFEGRAPILNALLAYANGADLEEETPQFSDVSGIGEIALWKYLKPCEAKRALVFSGALGRASSAGRVLPFKKPLDVASICVNRRRKSTFSTRVQELPDS